MLAKSFRQTGLFTLLFFVVIMTVGQPVPNVYPKVGDSCPSFILKNLHYYSKSKIHSSELHGKPIILDFFSAGCSACFRSFPMVSALSKQFKGQVQFFLIGKTSSGLQEQYEKYMKHFGINLPVEYDDSSLWNQFGIVQVPYTIWIDSAGIIQYITDALALGKDRIDNLLSGKKQSLTVMDNAFVIRNENLGYKYYDPSKRFLLSGNGGSDTNYLFRSILSNWDRKCYWVSDVFISATNGNRLNEIGMNLDMLYRLAYGDTVMTVSPPEIGEIAGTQLNHYGQWANQLVLETSRKSIFDFDFNIPKNIFSYSLEIPNFSPSAERLQHIMQHDLNNYFNYDVTVEKRKMPCWILVSNGMLSSTLRTMGGNPSITSDNTQFILQNEPINYIINILWYYNQGGLVFFNETGIDYNIDIGMHCIFSDFEDVKKELNRNGLDLIKAEREMKVIVIRDPR
jgi:thiol-disulfide isomerase/thioredoxin